VLRASALALGCLVVAVPLCACHAPARIEITVPHGYKGVVRVECDAIGHESMALTVDQFGNGLAASCPDKGATVFLVRDGHTSQVGKADWNRTGDGIVTGFAFDLR
jgi:hypothetical protein